MSDPDYLRVGDTERDAMTAALHEHFAQGRLTAEELDDRLTAALTARTVGELRQIDRDLPKAASADVPAPDLPVHGHHHRRGSFALLPLILVAVVAAGLIGGAGFSVVRVLVIFWLVMMIVRFRRARHYRRFSGPGSDDPRFRGPWGRGPDGPRFGGPAEFRGYHHRHRSDG